MPQKTLSKLMADTEKIENPTERLLTIILALPETHKEQVEQYLTALCGFDTPPEPDTAPISAEEG
jgi:hypothetical protein